VTNPLQQLPSASGGPSFLRNETYLVQQQQQAATPTSIRPDYVSPNQLSPLGRMQVSNCS